MSDESWAGNLRQIDMFVYLATRVLPPEIIAHILSYMLHPSNVALIAGTKGNSLLKQYVRAHRYYIPRFIIEDRTLVEMEPPSGYCIPLCFNVVYNDIQPWQIGRLGMTDTQRTTVMRNFLSEVLEEIIQKCPDVLRFIHSVRVEYIIPHLTQYKYIHRIQDVSVRSKGVSNPAVNPNVHYMQCGIDSYDNMQRWTYNGYTISKSYVSKDKLDSIFPGRPFVK